MAGELGTIRGQMILDVKQALASYTAARQAHISTVTALHTGAGAMIQSGTVIAAAGAAMAGGFVLAVKSAADFEKKLSYFGAVSDSTQSQMEGIRAKALELGKDTIYSAGQIADAFIELGKSGVPAELIIDGVGKAVANLGSAADLPLDTAANIITSAVQTFSLSGDQAVKVADQLAGAANSSIIDVTDLGTSIKYAGGVAASIGVPFADLNTAIALLGKYGIKGSTAGTSLRKILLSLAPTTEKAKDEFFDLGLATLDNQKAFDFLSANGFKPASKSLDDLTSAADKYFQSADGLTKSTAHTRSEVDKLFRSNDLLNNSFFDAEGKVKPLSQVFQILQDKLKGMTKEQKVSALNTLFQNRALASAIALSDSGAKGFDELNKAINKTTAAEVAGKRLNNLAGDIEILRGNIETLLIQDGGAFQNFARGVIQGVTKIIQWFSDLPTALQSTILATLGVGGAVLVAVGTFGIFAGSVLNIVALFKQMQTVIMLARDSYIALRIALLAVTAAQTAQDVAAWANPYALIALAIIALIAAIVLLVIHFKEVYNFLANNPWITYSNPITALIKTIGDLVYHFKDFQKNAAIVFNAVAGAIKVWWTQTVAIFNLVVGVLKRMFVDPVVAAVNFVIDAFNNLVSFFQTIQNAIVSFVANAIVFFQQLPQKIGAFFAALPKMIGFALGFIIGTFIRWTIQLAQFLATNIPIVINNIVSFFQKLPGQIYAFLVQVVTGLINWGIQMAQNAIILGQQIINNIITFFRELPARSIAFFIAMYNGIRNWLIQAAINALKISAQIFNNIVNFLRNLPANVAKIFQNVVNFIRTTFNGAIKWVLSIATKIYTTVRDAINGLPGLVKGIFDNVVKAIQGAINGAVKAITDFSSGLWEGFKKGLGIHSPSYIEKAMWQITGVIDTETTRMAKQVRTVQNLGNNISEVGNNLGNGFGDSFSTSLADLYNQVKAAKDLEASVRFSSTAGVDKNAGLASSISDSLSGLTGGVHIDKVEINNPEPEPASDSLPRVVRKLAYVTT